MTLPELSDKRRRGAVTLLVRLMPFVYWYLMRFVRESPFSHSALDIKTLVMAALGTEYREAVKRNMPRDWFEERPHNHVALDDAIGQGILFCNALAAVRRQPGRSGPPS